MTDQEEKEEQKIESEGEKAHYLIKSDEWKWAKRKLLHKLSNLDSVKTLKETEDVGLEIRSRKQTIAIILDWLDDIEGVAQQHREQSPNKTALKETEEEDYLHNEEDDYK